MFWGLRRFFDRIKRGGLNNGDRLVVEKKNLTLAKHLLQHAFKKEKKESKKWQLWSGIATAVCPACINGVGSYHTDNKSPYPTCVV